MKSVGLKHARTSPSKAIAKSRPLSDDLLRLFGSLGYADLVSDVVRSPAFARLRDIRFLGAIDYLIHPNGSSANKRHTRFEHSLRVAQLGLEYSRRCGLPERDEKHLVVAALLHDVGHGPLSHSLEPVFKERFRITHHSATELIIRGDVPIGSVLSSILRKYAIDRELLISLLSGESDAPYAEALASPINIDTIEAITRAFTYISTDKTYPPPIQVLHAVVDRGADDKAILDGFWRLKDLVYNQLINSRAGVVADYVCREYMRRNMHRFWGGNYFITETALRQEHPQLFLLLKQLRTSGKLAPDGAVQRIEYESRRFYIDESAPLNDEKSLHRRYRQQKGRSQALVPDVSAMSVSPNSQRPSLPVRIDLFPSKGSQDE